MRPRRHQAAGGGRGAAAGREGQGAWRGSTRPGLAAAAAAAHKCAGGGVGIERAKASLRERGGADKHGNGSRGGRSGVDGGRRGWRGGGRHERQGALRRLLRGAQGRRVGAYLALKCGRASTSTPRRTAAASWRACATRRPCWSRFIAFSLAERAFLDLKIGFISGDKPGKGLTNLFRFRAHSCVVNFLFTNINMFTNISTNIDNNNNNQERERRGGVGIKVYKYKHVYKYIHEYI